MLNLTKIKCCRIITELVQDNKVFDSILRDVGISEEDIQDWYHADRYREENREDLITRLFRERNDQDFVKFLELCLDPRVTTGSIQESFYNELSIILNEEGYNIRTFKTDRGTIRCKIIRDNDEIDQLDGIDTSSFTSLFRYGLPVAITKPAFSIKPTKYGQSYGFEESDEVGVLQGDIYPNFCIADLAVWTDPQKRLRKYILPELLIGGFTTPSWSIVYNLCQVDKEQQFLKEYLLTFVLPYKKPHASKSGDTISLVDLKDRVPALIPQVWIQWNSQKKGEYNRIVSPEENSITRADFAAFWNNRRFIVLIDGIQHYAKQVAGGRWEADEAAYAARVQEDRLLRTQGWHVFRVGNLEIRDEVRRKRVLQELREFIGFDEPPLQQSAEQSISVIRSRTKISTPSHTKPAAPPIPPRVSTGLSKPPSKQHTLVQPAGTMQSVRDISTKPAKPESRIVTFYAGQKVRSAAFGEGIVVSSKLVDKDEEVTVAFTGKGVKRLLASFAKLERADELEDLPF